MLTKLEHGGDVTVREVVDGGKYKKVYSLTEQGRARFFEWLEQPIELNRARHDHLVRVFFYEWLPAGKMRGLLEGFQEKVCEKKESLQVLQGKIAGHAYNYQLATLDYGLGFYDHLLAWCGDLLDNLERMDRSDTERTCEP